jgi:DNA-binding LytR/AlgR family response regulator
LLLDDELPGLTYLKMLCEQLAELEVVKAFNSPEVLLRELPEIDYDLLILDIAMPGINGLDVARLAGGKPIIFVTAHSEHAAEAFDLEAVDFVRKPVSRDRLQKAVQRTILLSKTASTPRAFVQLNTDKGRMLVHFDQLCMVSTSRVDSRDKVARMWDGTTAVLKNITLGKLLKLLPKGQFCQVNKQEAIAMKAVQVFTHDTVTTIALQPDGRCVSLTISDVYRADFVRQVAL